MSTIISLYFAGPEGLEHGYNVNNIALGEGKIFLAVATEVEGIGYHLMVLNNDGSIFKY